MLKTLEKYTPGVTLMCPFGKSSFAAMTLGYMDDNNLIQMYHENASHESIHKSTIDAFHEWEVLLKAIGGELSYHKCISYTWTWNWKHGLPKIENIPLEIYSKDAMSMVTPRKVEIPTKELGTLCAPSGTLDKEFKVRFKESREFADVIQKSSLTPAETWLDNTTIWEAKVLYYSLLNTFHQKEWEQLQSIILLSVLPKMKINRNMPRAVIFGTKTRMVDLTLYPHIHNMGMK